MVEVAPDRLVRWVERFGEQHGELSGAADEQSVVLRAADGTVATLDVPWSPWQAPPTHDPGLLTGTLARHALIPRTLGLLLIRRGGWAVGTCRDGAVLSHKSGTRYVQSRTAAGGWSQQRYARRRGGQADALVGVVAEAAVARLRPQELDGLVCGGDRQLVRAVLSQPRFAGLADLPQAPLMEVPDPRSAVLQEAARRALAVRVRIDEP